MVMFKSSVSLKSGQVFVVLLTVLLLGFASCTTVKFISDYDEQTDQSITAFQKKIETHLTRLERHASEDISEYENNKLFYEEAFVDLRSIRVRAQALEKNDITVQQVDLLIESLEILEKLHKLGISANDIPPLRQAFSTSTTAILKLELAKMRGKKIEQ